MLTKLLKESFSVDVNLSILINISANPVNMPETFSTLGFSTNCKKVKNKVYLAYSKQKAKEEAFVDEELKRENESLKQE